MNKTAFIFDYKGNLGATTDVDSGKFLTDPKGAGQLGCVIDVKEVKITKGAKEMLKNARREGGSFASIMLTKHSVDEESSIGLIGFYKHHFGTEIQIGRTCDKEVIDLIEVTDEEAPEDYKIFIDNETT